MGNQTSKITSCLIIKNEKDNIIPLVESLLKFSDEIMIADTGSTDGTLDKLMVFSGDDRVHLTFLIGPTILQRLGTLPSTNHLNIQVRMTISSGVMVMISLMTI